MIGRDEEKNLPRSLKSAKKCADEIIYVDTGSTDKSAEIAESHGAYVVSRKWRNDFSDARNLSIRLAHHQWILWLDCDDEIPDDTAEKINEIKVSVPTMVLVFDIENMNRSMPEIVPDKVFSQARMFPNFRGIHFKGKLHEVLGETIFAAQIPQVHVPTKILHHGYDDKRTMLDKMWRNNRIWLIEKEVKKDVKFIEFDYKGFMCYYTPHIIYVWKNWKIILKIDARSVFEIKNTEEKMLGLYSIVSAMMAEYEKKMAENAAFEEKKRNDPAVADIVSSLKRINDQDIPVNNGLVESSEALSHYKRRADQ
jgi:glycosyltransferase involved in cell wall biosynthesis